MKICSACGQLGDGCVFNVHFNGGMGNSGSSREGLLCFNCMKKQLGL